MNDNLPASKWPPFEPEHYFYFEAIESYRDNNRVMVAGRGEMLLLGGYSYLGLNRHPKINSAVKRAIDKYGTGTHGCRLLAGSLDLHRKLESRIAAFKKTESAVTFSSGYAANLATISALVGRHDTIICDRLNHASILDGCLLSQAKFVRFQHNDMSSLEHCLKAADTSHRRLVVVDAVFSMDGDIINLPEVSRLCRQYDAWLMVDEAHAIGVLGRTGRGIEEHFDLPPDTIDIKMGTLSKAIPSAGGFVAGSNKLCHFLSHETRAFIYSGALSPIAAATALAALEVIEEEPERVAQLHENIRYFADKLSKAGFTFLCSRTAIFPLICGEDYRALSMAHECHKRGVYVQAIPHPVVPKGMARLRISVSATHRLEDLDYCVGVLREAQEIVDQKGKTMINSVAGFHPSTLG
jgi:glycine C-acetyltransferase